VPGHSEVDSVDLPERGLIGGIRVDAGPAFTPATRLRVRGLNVLTQAAVQEKEKVSLTLDKSLVGEIRAQFGGRALSASINELLYAALAQERLGELVDEMEQERERVPRGVRAGPGSVVRRGLRSVRPAPWPLVVLDNEGLWAVARNESEDARAVLALSREAGVPVLVPAAALAETLFGDSAGCSSKSGAEEATSRAYLRADCTGGRGPEASWLARSWMPLSDRYESEKAPLARSNLECSCTVRPRRAAQFPGRPGSRSSSGIADDAA
jgi:hypothetical protein